MAKNENQTRVSDDSVIEFIASVEHSTRKADAQKLLQIFGDVTDMAPRMWGTSMIGYGEYHYKYDSGREGDYFLTGFSPRKANLVLYIMPGYNHQQDLLDRLGKHKIGKSCLYINKLADIDEDVLREIIAFGLKDMKSMYDWKKS